MQNKLIFIFLRFPIINTIKKQISQKNSIGVQCTRNIPYKLLETTAFSRGEVRIFSREQFLMMKNIFTSEFNIFV